MLDISKALIEHILSWPVVVFILALLFKKTFIELVGRVDTFKVSGVELSTAARKQQEEAGQLKGDLLAVPTSPQRLLPLITGDLAKKREAVMSYGGDHELVLNAIKVLEDHLLSLGYQLDSPDTVQLLIRHLAVTQVLLRAEKLYRLIFGSQIAALRKLNTGPHTEAEIRPFYERARKRSARFYAEYTFESWIDFLIQHQAVVRDETDRYAITLTGREFLQWLVSAALPRKSN